MKSTLGNLALLRPEKKKEKEQVTENRAKLQLQGMNAVDK